MNIYLILSYFATGIFAGLMSGLLGIGGGVVVVPALAAIFFHYSSIPEALYMKMAIGTSLAIMIVTLGSSVYAHHKKNAVNWGLVKKIAPGLMVGVITGAILVRFLPSNYLSNFFSIFLVFIGCQLLLKKSPKNLVEIAPQNFSFPVIGFFSIVIGVLSSVLGTGGGTMWVPFFLWRKLPMRDAIATSVACGILAALFATSSYIISGLFYVQSIPWSTSYIYWPAFFGVSIMSVLFAPVGANLAHRLPNELLRRIFAVFILLIALDMMIF